MKILLGMLLAVHPLLAQTNDTTRPTQAAASMNLSPEQTWLLAQQINSYVVATENIRDDCIKDRRTICGRIEKVLPDGLIVDSGYTSLLRPPLNRFWLVPGTVTAERQPHLVEGRNPDDICAGLVYLTDTPKSRLAKPKAFDYVILQAYPAGRYTYKTLGNLQRTVRHFSASLQKAVQINRLASGIQTPVFESTSK
jgi:hypothetical protein